MKRMRGLESLFRECADRPLWEGFRWIPVRRKLWRLGISTSELRESWVFEGLRYAVGAVCNIRDELTWTDVLKATTGLFNGEGHLEARLFVKDCKLKAFDRFCDICGDLYDDNTQLVSDGVSLKLRVRKDRTAANRERFGWKGAPLQVRGLSRLCVALDRQLLQDGIQDGSGNAAGAAGFEGSVQGGFMSRLERVVADRRRLAKEKDSGVSRVFDFDGIWDEIEEWAGERNVDVRETFSRVMAIEGDVGDTLRKSRLFAELSASVASRGLSPALLAQTTVFCFDFGMCKWIGGGVMLPTDVGSDADRVFSALHGARW